MSLIRRLALPVAVAAACAMLAACMVSPGKFAAALDLRKDGRFSFTYTGEITVLGLTRLAELGAKADMGSTTFEASECYDEKTEKERKCTDAEVAEQKRDWEEARAKAAEKRKDDVATMRTLFGGIDPTSPEAAEDLAERLRKQAGWNSVVYKGNGLYAVDYAMSGRLDHDFTFPTVERLAMVNPFVTVLRRADRSVRVDALAFGPQQGAGGMGPFGMMGAMANAAAAESAKEKAREADGKDADAKDPDAKPSDAIGDVPPIPQPEGTFTITTDGQILANNTEDGPAAGPRGQTLQWKVNARIAAPPMALIKVGG